MAKTVDQLTAAASLDLADYLLAYKVSGSAPFTRKATGTQVKAMLALTKSDVGLGNVDNTSDANKPISSATQTALNAKQDTLVSGTSIKTINGTSLLGAGNLTVSGGGGGASVELFISDLEDGVNISGIGAKQLLNTLTNPTTAATYTNVSAAAKFPYSAAVYGTIDVTTFTYDDVVVMEAFQKATLEDRWTMLKSTPNKTYYYTKGGFLIANVKASPVSNVDSKIFIFDMQGARFFYDGDVTVAHTLFKKTVLLANLGNALDRRWEFKNVNIDGKTLKAGSKGFEFCGGRSCNFQNIEIKNFDTAFHGGSLLQTQFVELATSQCEVGLLADLTLVSGATAAQAVWQPILYNCRFRGVTTTAIGCIFEGVEHPRLYDVGWEGSDMLHAVRYDNKGNSVGKKITIINPRCEINASGAGKFTGAAFKFTGSDYHFIKFEGAEIQNVTANFTLLDVESKASPVMVVMSNCFGNTSNNRWLLKSTDNGGFVAWDFDNVHLQGNPTTAANVVDTATYPNIWVGGVTPSRTVKISPRTL